MKRQSNSRLNPDTVLLIKQILYGLFALGVVILIIIGIWYAARIQSLTIVKVDVIGGETISHDTIESIAKQKMEGSYLGLIPKAFAWTYPQAEILDDLLKIERLHNPTITRISGTELNIAFEEYTPRALWCNGTTGHDCAFVDETGYCYTKAPVLEGGALLRFVRTDEKFHIGQTLLPVEEFDKLLRLVQLLAIEGWYISYLEVDAVGDAFLTVAGGGELKVVANSEPATTVSNLKAVLLSDEFKHLQAGNFQYIDLRFGSKVFVNEELAAPYGEESNAGLSTSTPPEVE